MQFGLHICPYPSIIHVEVLAGINAPHTNAVGLNFTSTNLATSEKSEDLSTEKVYPPRKFQRM